MFCHLKNSVKIETGNPMILNLANMIDVIASAIQVVIFGKSLNSYEERNEILHVSC